MLPGGEAPRLDLPPGEIARGIDTNGCWMVLKRIERDPAYARPARRRRSTRRPRAGEPRGRRARREGFIFLSAPNSTTPAHIDPEHNFLLQIRGTKAMVVGGFPDAETEQPRARALLRRWPSQHRWLPDERGTFPLGPGDGVYVPVHAPHLVRSGPKPSISLSVTFYTAQSERLGIVHSVNSKLRAARLRPSPGPAARRQPRQGDRLGDGQVGGKARTGPRPPQRPVRR